MRLQALQKQNCDKPSDDILSNIRFDALLDAHLVTTMKRHFTFALLLILLMLMGGYGVHKINNSKVITKTSVTTANETDSAITAADTALKLNTSPSNDQQFSYQQELAEIRRLLKQSQFGAAVDLANSMYSIVSVDQWQNFKGLFINTATSLWSNKKNRQAITLLSAYSGSFNDLDGWVLLSNVLIDEKQWQNAITALLKATAIEFRPDELDALMSTLVYSASHQRAIMEQQKDELGINQLYQMLYQHHPDNPRFQLELALSHLRLHDVATAKGLLEPLQYDANYGAIAKTALANIEPAPVTTTAPQKPIHKEIVVPLLRSGNSFFVNTVIDNRQLRLLLDTGASITALSQSTIQSLNLQATGKTIRLNTANGLRQSQLYHTDSVRLGSLTIKNLVVAEIEFEKNSKIHGLLGTDLLNQLDSRYSYIIDNQQNALIFKPVQP